MQTILSTFLLLHITRIPTEHSFTKVDTRNDPGGSTSNKLIEGFQNVSYFDKFQVDIIRIFGDRIALVL